MEAASRGLSSIIEGDMNMAASAFGGIPRPRDVAAITAEWLTSVMKVSGSDAVVASVSQATIGEGVGMMSGLSRLMLEYASGTGPASLIAKTPATNDANLAVAQAFNLYSREVLFYRDLATRTTARTPVIHYADIDPDGVGFLLLMEDLTEFRLGDQVEGCGLEEAMAGVEWLGRHHASFWGRTEDPKLAFLPAIWPSYNSDALTQGCEMGWAPMIEAFADVIPRRYRQMREAYTAAQPALYAWMASGPVTVAHGDFRMDNLFFGRTPESDRLIALDWQGALIGRGSQDLAYFLSGSVRTDVRRAHERELVARWHELLVAGGVEGYSLEDAWEDYRRAVAYVWTLAVVIAGTLDRTNERAHAWMSVMIERSIATMDDLDITALVDELAAQAG